MPFAAAGAIAGVASAAVGIAGSLGQKGAASTAGGQSQAALTQSRNDLLPWMTQGGGALGATSDLLGLNGQPAADAAMGNFQQSPGYLWTRDQGLRGVDAGAAARGMLRSGATLKGEMAYGQGLADQEFQQYYKNLAGLSGQGLSAAGAGVDLGKAGATNAQATGSNQASVYGNLGKGLQTGINDLFGPSGAFSGGGSGTGFVDNTSTF